MSRALRARHEEVLLHTGQHHDDAMSGSFFRDLSLPEPDVHLGLAATGHGARLAEMLRGISGAIRDRRPDAVLVYGDTDSTLAGALAAREAGRRLVHVEAGMRSGNPFQPEEINRIATDHLSDLLLAATPSAAAALRREGCRGRIETAGDVMLDVCLSAAAAARPLGILAKFGLEPRAYHVATVHRQENADDPVRLRAIVGALSRLPRTVLFACHPRTRKALATMGLEAAGSLRIVDPLPYLWTMALVESSAGVFTDSGGLQKEAMYLGVPCVTLRDETEWVETVASGWNRLAGADAALIARAAAELAPPASPPDLALYGGGRAAENVARFVSEAGA